MEAGDLLTGLWSGAEALLALLPALAALRLMRPAHALLAPMEEEPWPLPRRLAVAAGLALGVALLLALPHAESFRLFRIFAPDGPWRIGLAEFLARHGLPARATLAQALEALRGGGAGALPGGLGLLLLLAGLPLAVARRWRVLLAFLLVVIGTALLLHYAVHLLAWILALLNFWLFALALFGFQRWRHAPHRTHH
jgi:hypothetical protein